MSSTTRAPHFFASCTDHGTHSQHAIRSDPLLVSALASDMPWRTRRDPASGRWVGLELTVSATRAPGLVLDDGEGSRLRLRRGDRPLLWARVDPTSAGVWTLRPRRAPSPRVVPSISPQDARSLTGTVAWAAWFGRQLRRSEASPLQPGRWHVTELVPAPDATDRFACADPRTSLPAADPPRVSVSSPAAHFQSWDADGAAILPLRSPAHADPASVQRWRDHLRAHALPPVLLWWMPPLGVYVVLDGHDRLQAALEERRRPHLLALSEPSKPAVWDRSTDQVPRFGVALHPAFSSPALRGPTNLPRLIRLSTSELRGRPMLGRPIDDEWEAEVRAELDGKDDLARQLGV